MEGIQKINLEKNSMRLGHEEKNERFSRKKNVSPKERHASPMKKVMNDPSRRKLPSRFIIPSMVSLG